MTERTTITVRSFSAWGGAFDLVLSCGVLIAGKTSLNAVAEKRKPIFPGI